MLPLLTLACGAVIFVGLFAMKFLGPPPPAFVPRVAIVFVMLVLGAASAWLVAAARRHGCCRQHGLGFVLLHWYARE